MCANKVDMEIPSSDGLVPIMDLPDECLSIIFQCLDCSSDRESFGLTCHRWLSIQNINRRSLQFHCSLSIFLSPSPQRVPVIDSYHLCRMLTRFSCLECLSLSGCTELPDSALTPLQFCGSNLRSLHLDCCFRITDNGLSLVSASCRSLIAISLYRCSITDSGLESLANGCPDLKHINLSYCSLISDRGVRALSQACRHLQAVKISCCNEVSGTGFQGCSSTVTFVDASSSMLKPEGIMGIVSGGGLEYLDISSLSWLISGDGLAAIGSGFGTRLKVLNLRMCRAVGDESIMAIAKGCPSLEEWNLAVCHGVKLSGWEHIGINCGKLKKLHANRCRYLCDHGLQALREGCRKLRVLYISQNCRLSHTAIELFKLYRGNVEIKAEEILQIGPDFSLQSID